MKSKKQKDKIDQIQSTAQSITFDVDMNETIQQQIDNQLDQQADQQQNKEIEEKEDNNNNKIEDNKEEQKLTNQIQQHDKHQEDNNKEKDIETGEENGEEENEKDKKEQIKQEQKQEQGSDEQQQQIVVLTPQSAKQEVQQIEQDSNKQDSNEVELDIISGVDLQQSKTNAKELSINFELIDKYNTTTLIDPCMNNGNQKVKVGLSTAIIRLLESKGTSNEKKIDMITNIRNKFNKTESILKDMDQNKELKDKEGKLVKVSDLLLSCTELFKVLDMAEKEVEKAKQQGKDYKYNIAELYKESLIESEKDTNKIIINKNKEITAKEYLFGNDKQPKTDIQQERCKDLKEVKKEYGIEEEKNKEEQVKNYVEQDSEKQDTQQLKEENQKSKQQIDALKQAELNLPTKQQNATLVLSD